MYGRRRELRYWTSLERERLRQLRAAGVPVRRCAALLGMAESKVWRAVARFRFVRRYVRMAATAAVLRRLHRSGWTNREMAVETGYTYRTVCSYLSLLGLKANRAADPSLVRCFNCNRPNPAHNAMRNGWVSRELMVGVTEILCPGCFAAHGWANREGVA